MDNDDNIDYNYTESNDIGDDGYESNDEIKLEVTDLKNGNLYTHIYSVPYRPPHCKEKRLICFSRINNESCNYGQNCTYAHSLEEQVVDEEKKFIYKIILDKNLMDFFSFTNPKTDEIYKYLFFMTNICDNCTKDKCTGGYNCRNGVCDTSLKICKNDLLTGQCLNKEIAININPDIVDKILKFTNGDDNENVEICAEYKGCINGHHLSLRNLIPYYKYVHQKENSRKNKYQSVRYIDINPLNHIFNKNEDDEKFGNKQEYDSDESTDDEVNNWFNKENFSEDN